MAKKEDRESSAETQSKNSEKGSDLKITEAFKRIVSTGLGAAFMTEESVRNYLGDLKLPKEVLGVLLQGVQKSKEDLMQKVGSEIIKNLSKVDLVKVMTQFAQENKFKIHAEIEFEKKKKDEPTAPE